MTYAIYDLIADDIGQVTAAAQIPLALIYASSPCRLRPRPPCVPSSSILVRTCPRSAGREEAPREPRPPPGRSSSACSCCACPMAFAILGPCLAVPGRGGLLDRAGRPARRSAASTAGRCWPSRCSSSSGIIATRTEIADRLYDAALLLLGPLRAGLAYVNIGVSLGLLVDERCGPGGRRRASARSRSTTCARRAIRPSSRWASARARRSSARSCRRASRPSSTRRSPRCPPARCSRRRSSRPS